MSDPRRKPSNDFAISAQQLQSLLEAKAREQDLALATELASRRELIALREGLAAKMGRVTDPYELGRLILRELQDALGMAHGVLAVVGEDQFLEVSASTEALTPRYRMELIEEAFIVGEPLLISADDEALCAMGNADVPPGTIIRAVPFSKEDGQPLGVLLLEGPLKAGREAWVDELIAMIAQAVEDCRSYARLEGLIFDAALSLSRAHDERTPGHGNHAARVEAIARKLSLSLGLSETQVKRIRILALLHDMDADQVARGFEAIRRGNLTGAVWIESLAAPFVGGIYASPLADFQALVGELRFLYCRWDGVGNELPARGDEIPLAARIVAVAEAFEDLTGGRDGAMSIADAVSMLAAHSGTQYDPAVIRTLCDLFRDTEIESRVL